MAKNGGLFAGAVIVAAGKGTRMNLDISKQLVKIRGRPVIAWTLQAFEDCGAVDEVVLVANESEMALYRKEIIGRYGFYKVKAIAAGGAERQDSVFNGLSELSAECGIVLIHDGARPFIDGRTIIESVDAAYEYGASCVAVPMKDTVKAADKEGFVAETLDRGILWSIQTPQAFRRDIISSAFARARNEGFKGTDDAVLAERLGCKPKLVMGSYENIKITTREDLLFAEAIAAVRDKK